MLKNKSGFCGIGAYGGNQILPFYKAGYPCLFANTATTDLESLTEVEDQYKYQIPGGEGCNKDRTKSRELFRKDIDNIINEVKEKLPGIEYLFVVASLGGGTGAGSVMPMKRVAMNDLDIKACIIITVLPNTKTESIQALINSYETLAELEALTSLYTDALKAEVDALDKLIDKRKKAYDQQRKYTEYQKKVNSQQKNIDSIKAQIEAMKNSSDAATQARVKKLRQDLTDAEDELNSTKQDHRDEMISDGFSKISDDMADMLENVEYDISHSADKIYEIFHDMFGKVCADSEATYNKINSIITNTGFVGSTDFNNNQSQLGSSEGVKNQVSNASQSQTEANKNPSSSASGTVTSPIKDNKAENDHITNDIMKPEDTTNRKVAELKVSKSSVSVQEGQGTTLTYTIRPNDAVNKNLSISYSAPTIATASATNGVISINGLRPGSVTVTISTTDGSNLSQTVNITVTKKPDPPKPAPAPPVNTSGGDGVPRVGDVVTFTGKYYNDSWGARPVGGLYSGVQGGVVIDGRSARAYGGSARRTGDYSVHIKSADGRYGDLGWVKLSQLSGYKDGTLGVADDEYAWTGEGYKSELIVRNDGAILTHMNKGDGVVPNPETLKLMKFTEKYLNGEGELDLAVANLAQNSFVQEAIDGMKMAQSQNISNMKKLGNVTVENHYDSLLTVNGDIDKDAFPGVQEMCKKACDYTCKYVYREFRKAGFKPTMGPGSRCAPKR